MITRNESMTLNSELAYKAISERRKMGVDTKYSVIHQCHLIDDAIPNHNLIGKTIVNINDNRKYVVNRVLLHWAIGSYLTLELVNSSGDYVYLIWTVINSLDSNVYNEYVSNLDTWDVR